MLNFRHKAYIALDVVRVVNFIEEQMQTSGHFTGYSCMQRERITRLQEKEVSLLAYFVSATVHTWNIRAQLKRFVIGPYQKLFLLASALTGAF